MENQPSSQIKGWAGFSSIERFSISALSMLGTPALIRAACLGEHWSVYLYTTAVNPFNRTTVVSFHRER
ncbi:MAG: hypothetical protein ACRYFS_09920 [Janthinobacterium lividum]